MNLIQALVLLGIGYLALRAALAFFRPSGTGAAPGLARGGAAHNGSRVNPAHVEQVLQVLPQLSRRDVMWDLQRNGGSVQATTERVLNGRALEIPPPSFQPVLPTSPPGAAAKPKPPQHPDLITRYNLGAKVSAASSSADTPASAAAAQRPGWANNKAERQALLQRRRDDMILAARRRMEEKDREGTKP